MPEADLEVALAMVRRWHDQRPTRRRLLKPEEVRSVQVLGPLQIRLRTLLEDRFLDLEEGPPPEGPAEVEPEPEDPWVPPVDELDLEAMRADAAEERTRWTDVGSVIRPCSRCEGTGTRPCDRCGGDGVVDTSICDECGGEGTGDCRDCRGGACRRVLVRVRRRFRFHEDTRVHEGEDDEVGPHVLLHLVDHPTEGELLHEQDAPRIQRYAGKGSGTGYRTAATPMATAVERLLEESQPSHSDRIVHQWLSIHRIPVYALELSRGRSAYVYGDPPEVSPPGLLKPAWLVLVPLLAAMALLAGAAFAFFWLVSNADSSSF